MIFAVFLKIRESFSDMIPKRADAPMYRRIGGLTFPTFLELFLIFLFSMIDMIMIGRLSTAAMAGVGLTNQPFFLIVAVFQAVNVGTTTLVAWNIGMGNKKAAGTVTKQAIIFNVALGLILTIGGVLFAHHIAAFIGQDAEIIEYATKFLRIICYGIIFQAVSMCVSAAFRACGQAVVPMIYNIGSSGIKVFLNFVLIYGVLWFPELGVEGAAWATTISRIIAMLAALGFVLFWKNSPVRLKIREKLRVDFRMIRQIMTIGIPAAGEQFVIQCGLIFFTMMINMLDVNSIAAHTLVLNVNGLVFAVSQAFGVSTTTLVGQAVGADDYGEAAKYVKLARVMARVSALIVAAVCIIFARQISGFYTTEADVITIAVGIMPYLALVQFMQSTQMCTAGALRGAGDTMYPLYSTIFGIWIFRVGMCAVFIFVFGMGVTGAWLAFALDQGLRSVIVTLRFKSGKWKAMKAIRAEKTRRLKEKVGVV
jgi:putative MATE family efflux protein